jgi:ABC-2 type transport system permease protein
MYQLVLQDLRLCRWAVLSVFLVLPLLATVYHGIGFLGGNDGLLTALGVVLVVGALFGADDLLHSTMMTASLPYGRKMMLRARYVSIAILCLVVPLGTAILQQLLFLLVYQTEFSILTDSTALQCVIGTVSVLFAIPAVFRYGTRAGMIIGITISGIVAFAVLWALILLPWGDANLLLMLRDFLLTDQRRVIAILAVGLLLFAVAMFSYRISMRIFEKKDLG